MAEVTRRYVLQSGAVALTMLSRVASTPAEWHLDPSRVLQLAPGLSLDLCTTLPFGIARGGRFAVSGDLPSGLTLSPDGVLSVHSNLDSVSVENVVFTYEV